MALTTTETRAAHQGHGVEVRETVARLRRYAFLEEACIRSLAAWFLRVPRYEDKVVIGYQLWAHAERANDLRARLKEMRGGHHAANVAPGLQRVVEHLHAAPDSTRFLRGWSRLLRALADAYSTHLGLSDSAANAQEVRVLRRLHADAGACLVQAEAILPQPEHNDDWSQALLDLLAAAGGIDGSAAPHESNDCPAVASPELTVPVTIARRWPWDFKFDDRIQLGTFDNYADRMQLPFEQRRFREMEIYFNEFYAAGLLATIIVDAWGSGAPWDFFFDMSHHFWDEVRHAEFGMLRLRELGAEPTRVDLTLFNASRRMPFLHRLCYLTLGLEVYFMPRKQPRVRRYADAGDRRTQLFADVDWSDEGNHVQYGKRWVEFFLTDDARSVEDIQNEINDYLINAGILLPEGQMAPY